MANTAHTTDILGFPVAAIVRPDGDAWVATMGALAPSGGVGIGRFTRADLRLWRRTVRGTGKTPEAAVEDLGRELRAIGVDRHKERDARVTARGQAAYAAEQAKKRPPRRAA